MKDNHEMQQQQNEKSNTIHVHFFPVALLYKYNECNNKTNHSSFLSTKQFSIIIINKKYTYIIHFHSFFFVSLFVNTRILT